MKNRLSDFKKKFISLEEISSIYKKNDYTEIVELINTLIEMDIITPVKSSTKTAMLPRIYKKYKITKDEYKDETLENELKYNIIPLLSISFYKNNIKLYKKHREYILKLSDYLKEHRDLLDTPISINERSYEIFQKEKFLKDDALAHEIFKNLDYPMENLNFYRTPEPFFYYMCKEPINKKVLIVENKDTFYTIKRILLEDEERTILGEKIGCVIYGEGKKILSSIFETENCLTYQPTSSLEFIYWGDIDKEGFWIYSKLKETVPGYKISLFNRAYSEMILKSKQNELRMGKKQTKEYKGVILELNPNEREYVQEIIEQGLYIPQEIITFRDIAKNHY